MKTWLYLLEQDLFDNKDDLLKRAKRTPRKIRDNMLTTFKKSHLTPDDIKLIYLKPGDYKNQEISTWEQLLDLEIYRFTPTIIKGGKKSSTRKNDEQLDFKELMPFKPKVIKNTV